MVFNTSSSCSGGGLRLDDWGILSKGGWSVCSTDAGPGVGGCSIGVRAEPDGPVALLAEIKDKYSQGEGRKYSESWIPSSLWWELISDSDIGRTLPGVEVSCSELVMSVGIGSGTICWTLRYRRWRVTLGIVLIRWIGKCCSNIWCSVVRCSKVFFGSRLIPPWRKLFTTRTSLKLWTTLSNILVFILEWVSEGCS